MNKERAEVQVKTFIEAYGGGNQDGLSDILKRAFCKIYGESAYAGDEHALNTILAEVEGLHWLKDPAMRETNVLATEIRALQHELEDQDAAMAKMRERKDGAYLERNQLVAALSKIYPSGIAKTAIPGWSEDWHGCVYIDSPVGQLSWHYHESQAHLFAHLPPYTKPWDGHTTEEKYRRLASLA